MFSESLAKEIQLLREEKESLCGKIQRVKRQNQNSEKLIENMLKSIIWLKETQEKKNCELKKKIFEFCQFK